MWCVRAVVGKGCCRCCCCCCAASAVYVSGTGRLAAVLLCCPDRCRCALLSRASAPVYSCAQAGRGVAAGSPRGLLLSAALFILHVTVIMTATLPSKSAVYQTKHYEGNNDEHEDDAAVIFYPSTAQSISLPRLFVSLIF